MMTIAVELISSSLVLGLENRGCKKLSAASATASMPTVAAKESSYAWERTNASKYYKKMVMISVRHIAYSDI